MIRFPLLFVLVMEAFSKMMCCAEEGDYLQGFEVGIREEEEVLVISFFFS